LRTFGSTLMLFLLICGIIFICVISGSPGNCGVAGACARALLRLKPSRVCDNMGHYEHYGGPQHSVNALAGAFVGRPFYPCHLRFKSV
jgi:hypothetical protein